VVFILNQSNSFSSMFNRFLKTLPYLNLMFSESEHTLSIAEATKNWNLCIEALWILESVQPSFLR